MSRQHSCGVSGWIIIYSKYEYILYSKYAYISFCMVDTWEHASACTGNRVNILVLKDPFCNWELLIHWSLVIFNINVNNNTYDNNSLFSVTHQNERTTLNCKRGSIIVSASVHKYNKLVSFRFEYRLPVPGAKAKRQWSQVCWMLTHHTDGLLSSSF